MDPNETNKSKNGDNRVLLVLGIVIPVLVLGAIGYVVMGNEAAEFNSDVTATVIIDMGNHRVFEVEITSNQTTVYSFLLATCAPENANQTLSATYYSMYDSLFVESIGNRTNGDESKYWQYWINGEQTMVGADKQHVNDGDVILWSFEEMSF